MFGYVFAQNAPVTLQLPFVIRTVSEPLGNANLTIYLASSHADARLLTGGNDFFQAQLSVAEYGDKGNKHGDLRLTRNTRSVGRAISAALPVQYC
jgi:hypothetical protein